MVYTLPSHTELNTHITLIHLHTSQVGCLIHQWCHHYESIWSIVPTNKRIQIRKELSLPLWPTPWGDLLLHISTSLTSPQLCILISHLLICNLFAHAWKVPITAVKRQDGLQLPTRADCDKVTQCNQLLVNHSTQKRKVIVDGLQQKGSAEEGICVCSVPGHMNGTQGVEEERREHGSEILRNEFEMKLICNSKFLYSLWQLFIAWMKCILLIYNNIDTRFDTYLWGGWMPPLPPMHPCTQHCLPLRHEHETDEARLFWQSWRSSSASFGWWIPSRPKHPTFLTILLHDQLNSSSAFHTYIPPSSMKIFLFTVTHLQVPISQDINMTEEGIVLKPTCKLCCIPGQQIGRRQPITFTHVALATRLCQGLQQVIILTAFFVKKPQTM